MEGTITRMPSLQNCLKCRRGNRAIVAIARNLAVQLHRIRGTQQPYMPFCVEAASGLIRV